MDLYCYILTANSIFCKRIHLAFAVLMDTFCLSINVIYPYLENALIQAYENHEIYFQLLFLENSIEKNLKTLLVGY